MKSQKIENSHELLNNIFKNKAYMDQQKLINKRSTTIKTGINVVHLEYIGSSISSKDIHVIQGKLKNVGLSLSYFNKEGILYNNLDDYTLMTFIVLYQPIINELLKGMTVNAIWDVIKFVIFKLFFILKNKTINQLTGKTVGKKAISFGFKCILDKNTTVDFSLEGDLDHETVKKAIDKSFTFIQKVKRNKTPQHSTLVIYDKKALKWIIKDPIKEIQKKIKKK